MMKNIFIIFIYIVLVSCQTPSLNTEKQYEVNTLDLVSNKKAIIIFEDFLHGVRFQNVYNMKDRIYGNFHNTSNLQIFQINASQYVLTEGLLESGSPKMCLSFAGAAFALGFFTFGLLVPTEGLRSVPTINDNPAVIYFDIKPGEVIYVGSLNSSNLNCSFVIEDNFDNIKEKLSKTMPNIANAMQKKLMKLEKMPEACEDLTNEWSRDVNQNKSIKKIDLYQNYPACIEALNKLP